MSLSICLQLDCNFKYCYYWLFLAGISFKVFVYHLSISLRPTPKSTEIKWGPLLNLLKYNSCLMSQTLAQSRSLNWPRIASSELHPKPIWGKQGTNLISPPSKVSVWLAECITTVESVGHKTPKLQLISIIKIFWIPKDVLPVTFP